MQEYIEIGPAPADEDCAQVGSPDYGSRASHECKRFMDQLRKQFGPEPVGARLRIMRHSHDFGSYIDVAVQYDPDNQAALDYALRCESEAWPTWKA